MSEYVSWIKAELAKAFPQADPSEGVDLDGDGELEGSERIADFDGNGTVGDKTDWEEFLKNNEAEIRSIDGIFKWSAAFEPDNPINDLLSIESEIAPADRIQNAYRILEEKLHSLEGTFEIFSSGSPESDLWIAYMDIYGYWALASPGKDNSLFSQNLSGVGLDCDTSSMFIMALAHELDWPVYLVAVPGHIFARWDDGKGKRFNIDYGSIKSDESYIKDFHIPQSSIDNGIYLKNFTYEELLSGFNYNVGNALIFEKRYKEAIKYFDRAIELNPSAVQAYINRGVCKSMLGKLKEAYEDFERAHELDPNYAIIHKNLILTGLIPDVQLTLQPRVSSGENGVMNWRFALGATWPVIKMNDEVHLGPQLDIGYGAGYGHHMLDIAADFTFTYNDGIGRSFTGEAGVGYNFFLGGEDTRTPLPKGAFFQYGLHYAFPVKGSFGIDISILMQHNISDPSKFAILPGVGFQYKMW